MTFEEWFVAQHGKRPETTDINLLRDGVASRREILASDERRLLALEAWETKYNSARYAWNLSDADKRSARRGGVE